MTSATRPPLPVWHRNTHLKDIDSLVVKYQILNFQGKDILVGRLKVDTPTPSGHAFIIRRFDTGAVSLTTMFQVAFPNASEELKKREIQWVEDTYDLTGNNGSSKDTSITLLAGTWVSPTIAVELGEHRSSMRNPTRPQTIGERGNKGSKSVVGPGWGAREAINIYNYRKQNLVKDKIADAAQRLKDEADETLRLLNLPSSLEALEHSAGLPPSLLQKAEQVRLQDGPAKIEATIAYLQRLAMDILDNEAFEDEAMRKDAAFDRPSSHEANAELIKKERHYRYILVRVAASDETVRQKWDDWKGSIVQLTSDPASTLSPSNRSSAEAAEAVKHSRALRAALEALDSLHREFQDFVRQAQRLADADDIYPRVLNAASGLEKLAEVKPKMFEDVFDQELAKYDKFLEEINKGESKQAELLATIERRNEQFLQSRREDLSLEARKNALRSLDLSYQKYREIIADLNERIQFYNDLMQIFIEFKTQCRTWSQQRSSEIHALARLVEESSLQDEDPDFEPPSPPRRRQDLRRV
ncbi:pH-response regulator protein palA/RIM20 [Mycena venus]|uniref:pH-response regulator protein palA/RIM20 n=1 Tax=Mycena venus TaxID=2733690 RepID=A0A8H6XET3_9AGAR|nr:pH-response regulator protein palA/RIM20 [Mycena venus]